MPTNKIHSTAIAALWICGACGHSAPTNLANRPSAATDGRTATRDASERTITVGEREWTAKLDANFQPGDDGVLQWQGSNGDTGPILAFMSFRYQDGNDERWADEFVDTLRKAYEISERATGSVDGAFTVTGRLQQEDRRGRFTVLAGRGVGVAALCYGATPRDVTRCRAALDSVRLRDPGSFAQTSLQKQVATALSQVKSACENAVAGEDCVVERVALYDVAYPQDEADSKRMKGHAIVRIVLLTHDPDDLPVGQVYVRQGDSRTRVATIANHTTSTADALGSSASAVLGPIRHDIFVLLPARTWLGRARLELQVSDWQSNFELQGDAALAHIAQPASAPVTAPGQREVSVFIEREFGVSPAL